MAQLLFTVREGAIVDPTHVTAVLSDLVALRAKAVETDRLIAAVPGMVLPFDWKPLDPGSAEELDHRLTTIDLSTRLATGLMTATAALESGVLLRGAARGASSPGEPKQGFAVLRRAWDLLLTTLSSQPADIERWRAGRSLAAAYFDASETWLSEAATGAYLSLNRWAQVDVEVRRLRAAGLITFAERVVGGSVPPYQVEEMLRRGMAGAILRERLASGGLDSFDAHARDRLIRRFLESGRDVRGEMVAALPAKLVAARSFRPDRLLGRVGELNRELSRQRGGLSVRGIMSRFGKVVAELTPCLLMSPSSVARFLPPGAVDVDVVVFDEASQIRVAEAVGSMGRGSSVVVVGDSKQMPPGGFGEGGTEEDDDIVSTAVEQVTVPPDQESVLSECVESNLPRLWLSWHYRSQDESLIAFSNQHYYDGRLSSFPGPPVRREGLGVSWRLVNGESERGAARINKVEADAIVQDVRHRLASGETSLGIVTFNTQQRDLILDSLEESRDARVEAALVAETDPLFVKNLENVQGDERDVILFSLAFSRDPRTGKLPLNFGPLNRAGGERRLNVAVTRARRQVVMFSSFEPSDIDLNRTSPTGLVHLRNYLEMAARSETGGGSVRPSGPRDHHLADVADALAQAGLVVRRQVGLSDFTVDLAVAPSAEGPWSAVLLDGPSWARRQTVNDRDALPLGVLQDIMGWASVHRVWLPAWLHERQQVVRRVSDAVTARADGAASRADDSLASPMQAPLRDPLPTEQVVPLPAKGLDDELLAARLEIAWPSTDPSDQVYGPAELGPPLGTREDLDQLHTPHVTRRVRQAADEVIAAEAPVEVTSFARLVAARFGLQRVRADRVQAIVSLIPRGRISSTPLGKFVWAEGQSPMTYDEYRRTPVGVSRRLEEVARRKSSTPCGTSLTPAWVSTRRSCYVRATAELFGSKRLTAGIRARLTNILESAFESERLVRQEGMIHT